MKNILVCIFLLVAAFASGQTVSPDNRIVVLGSASIDMPANQVTFHVTLASSDSVSLDKVYENHRKSETTIYALLKELNIPSKNISYSMFSVGKDTDYDTKKEYFRGQQQVIFTLDSIKAVPAIQEKLIKGGFYQFGSSFTSTEMEKNKKELLEKAIAVAKEKATILANASERKIKRIVKVADTDDSDYTFSNYNGDSYAAAASAAGGSLTEIPQTVSISTTIKVTFELK